MLATVYGIQDISTGEIVYVGSTTKKVDKRISCHLSYAFCKDSDIPVHRYIRTVTEGVRDNFKERFNVLSLYSADVTNKSQIREKEEGFIRMYKPQCNQKKAYLDSESKQSYMKDWFHDNRDKWNAYQREWKRRKKENSTEK